MLKKSVILLAFAVIVIGVLGAQAGNEVDTAKAKLKAASAMKRTSFKKPVEEKQRILLATAAEYEKILKEHPDSRTECAEAAFRAGEIYRTLDLAEKAEAAFLRAVELDAGGEFAARSLNEIGHLLRRKEDFVHAAVYYQRVLGECAKVRDECADAWTWIGKLHLKTGDAEKGRETLVGFADKFPEFPVEAIRNIDLAALSLIEEGRADEAAALVAWCVQRFELAANGGANPDKDVEKALGKMKAAAKLEARPAESDGETAQS